MAHRTEAPSGLGYALENRLIVSTLFADPFRSMRVSRLAPTYSQLIATLVQAAQATMRHDELRARPKVAAYRVAHAGAVIAKRISSTCFWRAISASRWSKART